MSTSRSTTVFSPSTRVSISPELCFRGVSRPLLYRRWNENGRIRVCSSIERRVGLGCVCPSPYTPLHQVSSTVWRFDVVCTTSFRLVSKTPSPQRSVRWNPRRRRGWRRPRTQGEADERIEDPVSASFLPRVFVGEKRRQRTAIKNFHSMSLFHYKRIVFFST